MVGIGISSLESLWYTVTTVQNRDSPENIKKSFKRGVFPEFVTQILFALNCLGSVGCNFHM